MPAGFKSCKVGWMADTEQYFQEKKPKQEYDLLHVPEPLKQEK